MNIEDLKLEPVAKKAIDDCIKKDARLLMMVDGFISDAEALLLRDMLWYARLKGVMVIFAPKEEK